MGPVLLCFGLGLGISIGALTLIGHWQIEPPDWWP